MQETLLRRVTQESFLTPPQIPAPGRDNRAHAGQSLEPGCTVLYKQDSLLRMGLRFLTDQWSHKTQPVSGETVLRVGEAPRQS